MSLPPLRVLIVDDEPLARQRLLDLLAKEEDVEVVGTAATGRKAVDALSEHRAARQPVDLMFLDVQMPGWTGLDVIRQIGPEEMPVVIFVTAFDQHALTAFEMAAVDYLLKPFEDERFQQALQRARQFIRLRRVDELQERLRALLAADAGEAPVKARSPLGHPPAGKFAERLAVEMRGQVRVVPVEKIDFIAAAGPYAELHAGEETFITRDQMQDLEDRLDPEHFFRIHRSTIVRLDRVEALLTGAGGQYAVRLHDGVRLRVSRTRRDALAAKLGIQAPDDVG